MGKTDSSCIKMYKTSPHSCFFYLNWLQTYGIKYIHLNSTAVIFDLITLEVAKKKSTQIVFDHYRILMQNQVEIHF